MIDETKRRNERRNKSERVSVSPIWCLTSLLLPWQKMTLNVSRQTRIRLESIFWYSALSPVDDEALCRKTLNEDSTGGTSSGPSAAIAILSIAYCVRNWHRCIGLEDSEKGT